MNRDEIFDWVRQQYGTEPEYPWHDRNAVLRHTENRKWYGVILEVSKNKLGFLDEGKVDILNVKCEPMLIGSYRAQDGFYPAYHMNKDKWISILLDKPELDEKIKTLLALSFELTNNKSKEQRKY